MRLSSQTEALRHPRAVFRSDRWSLVRNAFLHCVDGEIRPTVAFVLGHPQVGGRGLRLWLHRLEVDYRPLPHRLPCDLVQVYLDCNEAEPLHDCAGCGIAIPVNPNLFSIDGDPDRVYFSECPSCGSATGLHAYWTHSAGATFSESFLARAI